jgi:hypothetical protein
MSDDPITISPGPQFRLAMLLAILADALQILIFPAFVEGALSPADDLLDLGIAAMMVRLLGWHWEFLPSFFVKLVPGVDLVPFWTIAVASVWRKARNAAAAGNIPEPDKKLLTHGNEVMGLADRPRSTQTH